MNKHLLRHVAVATFAFAGLTLAARVPAQAQTESIGDTLIQVQVSGHSFNYSSLLAENVTVLNTPADAQTDAYPGGPNPAATTFYLFNGNEFDQFSGNNGVITFYRAAELPGYPAEAQFTTLQTLLADRPALEEQTTLPFLPIQPAGQVVVARQGYFDTLGFSGISYVTAFRSDVSPFVASDFRFTFQGISLDGQWVVSAVFPVAAPNFPAEIPADFDYDAFDANFEAYLAESAASLNTPDPVDFVPTLDLPLQTIASLAHYDVGILGGGETVEVLPTSPAGDVIQPGVTTPTPVPSGDAGVLEGSYDLLSYGLATAPVPVRADFPISVTFSGTGISGQACNSFSGSFTYENNTLAVGALVSTLLACDALEQENEVLTALQNVSSFQVNGDSLLLFYYTQANVDIEGTAVPVVPAPGDDVATPGAEGTPVIATPAPDGVLTLQRQGTTPVVPQAAPALTATPTPV